MIGKKKGRYRVRGATHVRLTGSRKRNYYYKILKSIIKFALDLKVIEYTQKKNQMLFSLLNNLNIDPNFPPLPLLSNITFSKLA